MARPSTSGLATSLAAALLLLPQLAQADPRTTDEETERVAPAAQLDVSVETLWQSVHSELDCSDCHVGSDERKLSQEGMVAGEVQCLGCHQEAEDRYTGSVHAEARLEGSRVSARCQDCHGAHDVRATDDPRAHTNVRRVGDTCAACHGDPARAEWLGIEDPEAFHTYRESIHGQVLLEEGTTVAPSCVSCHGSHSILDSEDPSSRVHVSNVASTCGGSCHAGVERKLDASVHGAQHVEAGEDAPTCIDCHTAHDIEANDESFKLASDRRCGSCHEEAFERHLGTYHGRAHALGGADVAACADCHGSHGMVAMDDPGSRLAAGNRIDTCRSCHEDAPAGFASYEAHGSPDDPAGSPVLHETSRTIRGVLAAAVFLFLLHGAVWLGRSSFDFARSPRRFRDALRQRALERERIQSGRIGGIDKLCHGLLLSSFALLIATGVPLLYHQEAWAQTVFGWLGGADVARAWHRVGAIMTVVYAVAHISTVVARTWRRRAAFRDAGGRIRLRLIVADLFAADSPVPSYADLDQMLAHVKWFLGRGPAPRVTRYAYWEKLDYVATFFAVVIIGFSGVLLWAPEAVTHVLPGWTLNIAQLVHGQEALFAGVLVFVLHTFHVLPALLRPGLRSRAIRRRPVRSPAAPAQPRLND